MNQNSQKICQNGCWYYAYGFLAYSKVPHLLLNQNSSWTCLDWTDNSAKGALLYSKNYLSETFRIRRVLILPDLPLYISLDFPSAKDSSARKHLYPGRFQFLLRFSTSGKNSKTFKIGYQLYTSYFIFDGIIPGESILWNEHYLFVLVKPSKVYRCVGRITWIRADFKKNSSTKCY